MKKLAVISDIHGNYEALLAVVKDLKFLDVNEVLCLGDVVGYGPLPEPCLELLLGLDLPLTMLRGNHEDLLDQQRHRPGISRMALVGIDFSRQHLSEKNIALLIGLPNCIRFGNVVASHDTLYDPGNCGYVDVYEEDGEMLAGTEVSGLSKVAHVGFLGHTHRTLVFSHKQHLIPEWLPLMDDGMLLDPEDHYLINPGSVGQPRDGDPRASYGVLPTSETMTPSRVTFLLRRLTYDVDKTVKEIAAAALPERLGERLLSGS